MTLGLLKGVLACGILVVPSRELYKYLTDRIGNTLFLERYGRHSSGCDLCRLEVLGERKQSAHAEQDVP